MFQDSESFGFEKIKPPDDDIEILNSPTRVSNITNGETHKYQLQKLAPRDVFRSVLPPLKKIISKILKKLGPKGKALGLKIKQILTGYIPKNRKKVKYNKGFCCIVRLFQLLRRLNGKISLIKQIISQMKIYQDQKFYQPPISVEKVQRDEAFNIYWKNIQCSLQVIEQASWMQIVQKIWSRKITRIDLLESIIDQQEQIQEQMKVWYVKNKHVLIQIRQ